MNQYRLFEEIGRGNYSTIYRAMREADGRMFAIKKSLFPYSQLREQLLSEVSTLRKLQNHPTVIRLVEVIVGDRDEFYMVFEHLPMSLIECYKLAKASYNGAHLAEHFIRSYMFQIGMALEGLHRHHVMHRDIKPENIMVDGLVAKLIDFGLSKKNDFGRNTQYVSTRWYRAPEILLSQPYSFSSDIFSLGCVLLELYHKEQVFRGASAFDQLYKLGEFLDDFDNWPAGCEKLLKLGIQLYRPGGKRASILAPLPEDARDLVAKMLTFNPHQRISAHDMLKHRFFRNVQLPQAVVQYLQKRRNSKTSLRSSENQLKSMRDVLSQKKIGTQYQQTPQPPHTLVRTQRAYSANHMAPANMLRSLADTHLPTAIPAKSPVPQLHRPQRTTRCLSLNYIPEKGKSLSSKYLY